MSDHRDLIVLLSGFVAVFLTTGIFFVVLITMVENIYSSDSIVLRLYSSISVMLCDFG
ncbi:hypothetical protein C8D90_10568 [Enterobacillus tribolii]|uniref:Uncharacterized protein n=1 Tax=Enterobacillus tribolii TaxID=1487935 RepID=A0A370QPS4_9GAMM|nr:hypothetical protein C8D90_10568 [Enterobacillus tribolii]